MDISSLNNTDHICLLNGETSKAKPNRNDEANSECSVISLAHNAIGVSDADRPVPVIEKRRACVFGSRIYRRFHL